MGDGRTGQPVGRPPIPEGQRLRHTLRARFGVEDFSLLEHLAGLEEESPSSLARSVLETAQLSVPELALELQEELQQTGHELNDLVYRLHASGEPLTVGSLPSAAAILRSHRQAIRKALDVLEDADG